jgi:aspartyl-tRNA(Asn)/glutamyl-tRNA(Gln) amidotransferase subunit A
VATQPANSCLSIASAVRTGERRAADLVAERLEDIAAHDPSIRAFVETFSGRAIADAESIDAMRRDGKPLPPLAGVPIAIKDNFLLEGEVAACGSKMLARFRAPYTATVVARLRDLGAVIVGRTNMDEFGMGSSTERSAFFPTKNPWDRARVPGGSSGGAAAAVAFGLCPLALGSDTGGSVRQPAALCGVTGLKPTYGRLSRYGLVAYASSLDCPGFLARTAEDVALAMQVAGLDPRDATTLDAPASECALTVGETEGARLRIGVLRDDAIERGIDAEVGKTIDEAIARWKDLRATVAPVTLPHARHAIAAYYLVASAEASSNLARYDGIRYGHSPGGRTLEDAVTKARSEGFGPEVKLRILLGAHALQHGYHDELYGHATRVRRLVADDFAAAFAHCDVVAMPTAPGPAFPLGSRVDDPVAMYACDALTVPASLAGLPAISFPCGFTKDGMPVGMQFVAPPRREGLLLAAAHAWQRATDHHLRRPAR